MFIARSVHEYICTENTERAGSKCTNIASKQVRIEFLSRFLVFTNCVIYSLVVSLFVCESSLLKALSLAVSLCVSDYLVSFYMPSKVGSFNVKVCMQMQCTAVEIWAHPVMDF